MALKPCVPRGNLTEGLKQAYAEDPRGATTIPFADQPQHGHLSAEDLEKIIRDKIQSCCRNATVQKQRMYALFGRPTNGISRAQFKKRLRCWGVNPQKKQMDAVFEKWDADGNGKIDFSEFMEAVLDPDYRGTHANMYRGFTEPATTTFNDVMLAAMGQRRVYRPNEEDLYEQIDRNPPPIPAPSMKAIEDLIREKIRGHSIGDNVEKAHAFRLFGRPAEGITRKVFKWKLNQWCVHMKPDQFEALFNKFDKDNSGTIDFYEFMAIFGAQVAMACE